MRHYSKLCVRIFYKAFVLADKFFSENPDSASPQTVRQNAKTDSMTQSQTTSPSRERKPMKKGQFRTTWLIRLIYTILILLQLTIGRISNGFNSEIVVEKSVEHGSSGSRFSGRSQSYSTTYLTTDKDSYTLYYSGVGDLNSGDTILIERNILNKPIYFTKDKWDNKYEMNLYRLYYVLFGLTIFSFLLNGKNKTTRIILWTLAISDTIAFLTFFFG